MGKKKKKDKSKVAKTKPTSAASTATAVLGMVFRNQEYDDAEGFATLSPTVEGQQRLDEVALRRGKKAKAAEGKSPADPTPPKKLPYEEYNPKDADTILTKAIEKVSAGKFGKAGDLVRNSEIIAELIDAYLNMESGLDNFSWVTNAISKLLRVGKSFYEYAPNTKAVIDNATYDRILARYTGFGNEEPTGIVPKNSKGKTSITYPTLHNNMDKAYTLRTGDTVPVGVKETGNIEEFLIGVYKDLGISSEAEIELELSPKIDGVSVNGTISGVALTDPQTRGDEAVSMRVIGMNHLEVGDEAAKEDFGIQYEVFVTNEDMLAASEYLKKDPPYVSNRHAAAGIVNRLCTNEDDNLLQYLSLYPIEAADLDMPYAKRIEYLQGFGIMPKDMIERKIIKGNLKDLLDKIEKRFEKFAEKRETLSYAIDGMVITVVDDDYQSTLGRSGRTNKYQMALKFDPASAVAEVSGMHLDSGKKGFRTVQIDLRHPVFLDGVRYDHVPVLSAGLFEDMDIRVGSTVRINRVGDVIPSITVIKSGKGERLTLPKKCPICGDKLIVKNKKLFCQNTSCLGNISGRIIGFLSGIGMDGYGDSFADSLVDVMGVQNLADLFHLTADGLAEKGLTDKIYRKFPEELLEAIAKTKDYKIFGSMGIPDVGPARAKSMFKAIGEVFKNDGVDYVDALISYARFSEEDAEKYPKTCWAAIAAQLSDYPGCEYGGMFYSNYRKMLGNVMAEKICKDLCGTKREIYKLEVDEIGKHITDFTTELKEATLRLGHTGVEPSADVKRWAAIHDAEIVDGKGFDILLTVNHAYESEKMSKAKKKNLPVYTEDELLEAG